MADVVYRVIRSVQKGREIMLTKGSGNSPIDRELCPC